MKKLIIRVFALLVLANTQTSCGKKAEEARPQENECLIYLKDRDGLNLIGTNGQPYHPDSIGVARSAINASYKEHGRAVKDKNNEYCFYVVYSCCMNGANFYVRLKNQEIDTVRVVQVSAGPVNFYYNSQLKLSTRENLFNTTPSFTINK